MCTAAACILTSAMKSWRAARQNGRRPSRKWKAATSRCTSSTCCRPMKASTSTSWLAAAAPPCRANHIDHQPAGDPDHMSSQNQDEHLELLHDGRHYLGEGVVWCERTGRVFWTDIGNSRLHALAPETGVVQEWPMPERLACFALTDDDDVL